MSDLVTKICQRLLLAAALFVPSTVLAAQVAPITGPVDVGNAVGVLNTLASQINGSACSASGASPQTCNGTRGSVVTGTLTTAAATNATYVINNSLVNASSIVICDVLAYSGTLVTNGYPMVMVCTPAAGTITVNITNVHPSNALNGTLTIGFGLAQN